jgi:hypothetical protein
VKDTLPEENTAAAAVEGFGLFGIVDKSLVAPTT